MPIEVKMPRLSDTMEVGTVVKWNVKPGQKVKSGDILADIETDKATMELQSFDDGTVAAGTGNLAATVAGVEAVSAGHAAGRAVAWRVRGVRLRRRHRSRYCQRHQMRRHLHRRPDSRNTCQANATR